MRLLLLSNSTMPGKPYLEWPRPVIDKFLSEDERSILFIPFAGVTISWDDYEKEVAGSLGQIGCKVQGIQRQDDPIAAIQAAKVIAIGGGNTFQLLAELHKQKLIGAIQAKVEAGTPLISWSAGSNVCCPTLKTTNDMPIVEPESFDALAFVPFQINAHYTEQTLSDHGGESRRQRLKEFLVANKESRIAALPEGAYLRCEAQQIHFEGPQLKVLQHDQDDRCYQGKAVLTWNLDDLKSEGDKSQ